jgi:hypothetical protein
MEDKNERMQMGVSKTTSAYQSGGSNALQEPQLSGWFRAVEDDHGIPHALSRLLRMAGNTALVFFVITIPPCVLAWTRTGSGEGSLGRSRITTASREPARKMPATTSCHACRG